MNNINILNRNECSGCSVCYKVCPHNAISMVETKEGFHYPLIDDEKCTDCGVCVKRCHALNDNFKTDHRKEFYEVKGSDEIRMKSSSGGMFSLVADYILDRGGYVCAASFTKDWLGVEHIIIDNKKDLDKLRYSKYIESNLGDVFIDIKKLLNENKEVLFVGAPCQVSALNHYLGREYDNLLTMDFLCHGVVPQKVWDKYIREKVSNIEDIEYVSFRDKNIFNWNVGLYIKTKNNEYIEPGIQDTYMKVFLNHAGLKEECLHCKYRSFDRVGDITIGDYWSVKSKYKDDKGISLIKISSDKASRIFDEIKSNCEYKKVNITHDGFGPWILPVWVNRKYFFDNLDKEPIEELYKHCSDTKYNVAIINMMFTNNAGGVLTYYALYKLIEQLGYNPVLIYDRFVSKTLYDNTLGCKIAYKYCNVGNSIYSDDILKTYNELCSTFVIGSDIVWAPWISNIFYNLLGFTKNNHKKISFASSYATDLNYKVDSKKEILMKYLLKQLDNISVREDYGVDISRELFDVNAEHVLDPVFLIDNYDELSNNSKLNIDYDYIAVYYVNLDKNMKAIINYISDKLNLKVIKLQAINGYRDNPEYSIEDWIYILKNSKYIITDSFHGLCFALIFNKDFIVKKNVFIYRHLSLVRIFKLENRLINNVDDIINNKLLFGLDYVEINKVMKTQIDKSIKWLKNALEKEKIIKEYSYKDDLINILIKDSMNMSSSISNLQNNNNKTINDVNNNINDINNKINKIVNSIAWWIPVRKWRDNFRNKMLNADQTRPDQTRPDQTRPTIILYGYN
ncbi:polysaccharide pyruvyl transferase family protein [Brachyspira intermedia]|uniref:polysaccharide pyruvyl transferase family protein n=1 Tax=Brachyspira intermedia TaxID=84377 RepID=UPI0030045435